MMEFLLDDEPGSFKKAAPLVPELDELGDLPPPRRAGYAPSSSRPGRSAFTGADLAVRIVGWFVAICAVAFAGLWLLCLPFSRVPAALGLVVFFSMGVVDILGIVASLFGLIWLLVIAFRESVVRGVLCAVCFPYLIGFTASRWSETRGAVCLMFGPLVVIVGLALALPFMVRTRNLADLTTAANPVGAARPAEARLVRAAEATLRQNIEAINRLTAVLARVQDEATARESESAVHAAGEVLRDIEVRGQSVTVGRAEIVALKHAIGKDMCIALAALEREFRRVQSIPGVRRPEYDDRIANIERSIQYWSIADGEQTAPALVESAPSPPQFAPNAGGPPFPVGGGPFPGRGGPFANRGNPFPGRPPRPTGPFGPFGSRPAIARGPDQAAMPPQIGPAANPGPAPAARPPKLEIPADADPVARSLIELKADDKWAKKQAVQRLERTAPDQERTSQVVAALLPILNDDDGFLVNDTIKALANWPAPEVVPALIQRTKDNRFHVRHEAIKALGKLKDVRAVEPLVDRFSEDGFQTEAALKQMGSIAEPPLIAHLRDRSAEVRRKVCEILKEIGGKETLKAMDALPTDPDLGTRMAAAEAYRQIAARVGVSPVRSGAAGRGRK